MLDFVILIITLVSCGVIVIVVSKMSQRTFTTERYHYRCSNNFRHIFSVYEIEVYFSPDKPLICPIHNCGGELILYELLQKEEEVEVES